MTADPMNDDGLGSFKVRLPETHRVQANGGPAYCVSNVRRRIPGQGGGLLFAADVMCDSAPIGVLVFALAADVPLPISWEAGGLERLPTGVLRRLLLAELLIDATRLAWLHLGSQGVAS